MDFGLPATASRSRGQHRTAQPQGQGWLGRQGRAAPRTRAAAPPPPAAEELVFCINYVKNVLPFNASAALPVRLGMGWLG